MAQTNNGLRALLSMPRIYDSFQDMIGADHARRIYVEQFMRVAAGERVLDIGCGTGAFLKYLPTPIDYVGFDASPRYIDAAKRIFGERGRFFCNRVSTTDIAELGQFDLVIANGLLHHLTDEEALALGELASQAMKPNARLVTTDPCFIPRQNRVARFIISQDRGRNVRSEPDYLTLMRHHFSRIEVSVRHDLARIPYTHIIMVCRK